MKKTLLFIAILFVSVATFAQTEPELKLNKETNLVEATYFHENGEVSQKGTFNMENKLHGKWISYNEVGEKISAGTYVDGKKTGKWTFYAGDDKKVVEYSNNAIAAVNGKKTGAVAVN